MLRSYRSPLASVVAAMTLLLLGAGSASAVTITEFSAGITPGTGSSGMAAGPDGTMWFTEPDYDGIGRIARDGTITEFYAGITAGAHPTGIAAGPDGNMWFTEPSLSRIGRITPAGVVTEFSAGITPGSGPLGITLGPDGNLWFTEYAIRIGRITPSGVVTEFSAGTAPGGTFPTPRPASITAGPDGNLWYTLGVAAIGRMTTSGQRTEFSVFTNTSRTAGGITAGPDGNIWFILEGSTTKPVGKIGRLTPSGTFTEFETGITDPYLKGIAAGPDGNLWFTENVTGRIGRITTAGVVSEFTGIASGGYPWGIAPSADGNLWFTEATQGSCSICRAGAAFGPGVGGRVGRVIPDVAPVVATGEVGTLTGSTAVLNGTVRPRGASTTYRFVYGTTVAYGQSSATQDAGAGDATLGVGATIAGLAPNTGYHYRLLATNASGTSTGPDRTFTSGDAPVSPIPTATASPTATVSPTPTAAPLAAASPTATPTPTATPKPRPPATISVPFSGRYSTPGVAQSKACRGTVTIVLSLKGKELGRRRARLDRKCRYGTTFKVARKKIGTHKSLTVVVQFHGNRYLGANRSKFTALVPSA